MSKKRNQQVRTLIKITISGARNDDRAMYRLAQCERDIQDNDYELATLNAELMCNALDKDRCVKLHYGQPTTDYPLTYWSDCWALYNDLKMYGAGNDRWMREQNTMYEVKRFNEEMARQGKTHTIEDKIDEILRILKARQNKQNE